MKCIFNMVDMVRISGKNNSDYIESHFQINIIVFNVSVDCFYQMALFFAINKFFRFTEKPSATGFHFCNHQRLFFLSDDIDLLFSKSPFALETNISFFLN